MQKRGQAPRFFDIFNTEIKFKIKKSTTWSERKDR